MGSKNKTKIGLESITNKAGMLQAPVERTPVQLPDKFESNFITTDLIKEIKVTVESIQTLLTTKAQIDMRIAEELATLKANSQPMLIKKSSTLKMRSWRLVNSFKKYSISKSPAPMNTFV